MNDSYIQFITAFLATSPLDLAEATPRELHAWLVGQIAAAQAIVDSLDHRLWTTKLILEGLVSFREELDRPAGGVR